MNNKMNYASINCNDIGLPFFYNENVDINQDIEYIRWDKQEEKVAVIIHYKRKALEFRFAEQRDRCKKKDVLKVDLRMYKSTDFSEIIQNIKEKIFGTNTKSTKLLEYYEKCEDVICDNVERVITEPIRDLLEKIYEDSESYFTIENEFIEYIKEVWTKTIKTVRKAFRGIVAIDKLKKLIDISYEDHKTGMGSFENKLRKNRAPLPRALSNMARIQQAHYAGIEKVTIHDKQVIVKDRLQKVKEYLSSSDFRKSLTVFAFTEMSGLEILCTMMLIQMIRENEDEVKDNTLIVEKIDFIKQIGIPVTNIGRKQLGAIERKVEETLRNLSSKRFLAYGEKDATKILADYQLFTFTAIKLETEGIVDEIWKISGFDSLRFSTYSIEQFTDFPIRPLKYIAEKSDSRRYTELMRLCADVLLNLSYGNKNTKWKLSSYNLDSGKGLRKETSNKDREILIHALTRYSNCYASIENGFLFIEKK